MRKFNENKKPVIVVSKCLNFDKCRYNGDGDNNKFIDKLKNHVIFKPICPEVEIGLPTPRKPIRLVRDDNDIVKLLQPKTGNDYSKLMYEYADSLCENLGEIDGFILKSRSPSCGIKDVKIYEGLEKGAMSKKGKGIVGGRIVEYYGNVPIEDDGRLKNFKIREDFLTKLYTLKGFKNLKEEKSLEKLRDFHTNNKLLLMSYHAGKLSELGKILGRASKETREETYFDYEDCLVKALSRSSRYKSNINVLNRCLGYFSKDISNDERKFILELINSFKDKRIPLSVPMNVIKSYVIRFNIKNLMNQSFFEPYPSTLIEVTDSGKGRE
ncbi:YbgA family protein [Oceanirhabdus sp. W0125-5]|uniref:YbgA family protein n=1 Tax=Oceanirhabdus sp. W0125-5 TaxID=2999116 RepID=UPI0022F2E098|nr:DUF523 and DUF1722 domain-containing protein [Oceanirhabdus sp. W0125-5]WBW95713.1 DUF523 and DUF1722 domain-containing protein [Oceanirhabdus sp. W0125-5]